MTPYSGRRNMQRQWDRHLTDLKLVSGSVVTQLFNLLSRSWMNALLLCVPAGMALHAVSGPLAAILVFNFLAAIGLHGLGDPVLRSITSRIGRRYGMLLYISARYVGAGFQIVIMLAKELNSNLTQAISSVVLLLRGEIVMMQMTLIGNLLVNLLLLPALSIFYATYHRKSMTHDYAVTRKYTLLLFLSTGGYILPTTFNIEQVLPIMSIAGLSSTFILPILAYGAYLFFQLSTHKNLFERDISVRHSPIPMSGAQELVAEGLRRTSNPRRPQIEGQELSIWTAAVIFIANTALIYFTVEFFVDSVLELGMEEYFSFSGYVLIPILNSDVAAFEQVEQSMDMVLSCTLDKSLQLSLFVSPSLVLVVWGAGYGEDGLSFDAVGVTALFMSVYLVNGLSASGNFNWLVTSTHPTVALHIAPS